MRQVLVEFGVSEFGGQNCIARLGKIIGKFRIINILLKSKLIVKHGFMNGLKRLE